MSLIQFLQRYQLMPHPSTGCAPADLVLKHSPRSQWDMLHPTALANLKNKKKSLNMKHYFDKKTKEKELAIGLNVFVRIYHGKNKWVKGVIVERRGAIKWLIRVNGYSKPWARHSNQICHVSTDNDNDASTDEQLELTNDLGSTARHESMHLEDCANDDAAIAELTDDNGADNLFYEANDDLPQAAIASPVPDIVQEQQLPLRKSTRER
uniref:Uncharacterized protein n=1 Tax=Plectus sambesii TaxID=2011161 RepID=A0A914W2Y8_9BILA